MKRDNYISWESYFMGIAQLSALRSKDPSTQVGACIVSSNNKILSMGYNGLPIGCSDDEFPWTSGIEVEDSKYLYVTHAELNAILNYRGAGLDSTTLYVTQFPCNECAKAIIQSGIKKIIYYLDKHPDRADVVASKRMLEAAGVDYQEYKKNNEIIKIKV